MKLEGIVLFTTLVTTACVTPDDEVSVESAAIESGVAASQFELDRAVKIPGCTATRINARFAITAAHCQPSVGATVNFYDTGPGFNASMTARIDQVILRPGVSGAACFNSDSNCLDSTGKFADVALLRLSTADEPDLEGPHATLAWVYPGDGVAGKKVGAGSHDGNVNSFGILLQATDETSSDDGNGRLETVDDDTDKGDSGGPFYVGGRVLGVLWGEAWVPFDWYNIYTSIPSHLDWILTNIGYSWRGQPSQANTLYSGTVLQTFFGTERVCQYACEKMASCEAYAHNTALQICQLVSEATGVSTGSGFRGALKHGARTGNSNDIVGYVRSDGRNAVVRTATNGRIHELLLDGAWGASDIHGNAPGVSSRLTAYRRSDNINAIVYRSTSNRIVELAFTNGIWSPADLTTVTGAEAAAGSPTAYIRTDGVSAVVYRGATTGHIIELRLGSRGWLATDLSVASGSNAVGLTDPTATVRSDGLNSIVFRSISGVSQLSQANGGKWTFDIPSAGGAPVTASRPFVYTHRDGTNAIVYRSTANQVVELTLENGVWLSNVLAVGAAGDPIGYVHTDRTDRVAYRISTGNLMELKRPSSTLVNMTATTGASTSSTDPAVYHRNDGVNSVLFETAANHAIELFSRTTTPWSDGDLTTLTGELP
ncbi:MAG: trypsin-like serine protease [Kofleriaceae bacterium]|nr:trypsin-like serine protease [Kofleriaceae bacterium]